MNWDRFALDLLAASLVRSAVPVAAAACLIWLLRVKHPASRHAIWTAVMAVMLLTPLVSVWLPHIEIPLPRAFDFMRQPTETSQQNVEPYISNPAHGVSGPEIQIGRGEVSIPSTPPTVPQHSNQRFPLLIWIYLSGLIALAGRRLAGFIYLRRVISRAHSLQGQILRESRDVLTPVTVGLWRPVVLLPEGWREWKISVRRMVLTHELTHIRRRDPWIASFVRFASCMLWFQPLTWWVARRISELAEMSCDLESVRLSGISADYAQVLLDFSAIVKRSGYRTALAGLSIHGSRAGSSLSRRVELILSHSGQTFRPMARPIFSTVIVGAMILGMAALPGFVVHSSPMVFLESPSPPPTPAIPPTRRETPIQISQQTARSDEGTLAGRIILPDGSPASDIPVVAMLGPERNGGITSWRNVMRTRTDSDGRYGMTVPAGRYTIAAASLTTYYPEGISADDIRPISVSPGQEVAGLDFRIDRRSGVRVRGRVISLPGQDVTTLKVGIGPYRDPSVQSNFADLFGQREFEVASVNPDGSFQFSVVPPGIYGFGVPHGQFYSEQRFGVDGSNITLDLPATAFVKGRLVLDDGGQLPIIRGSMPPRERPVRVRADGPEGYSTEVSPDGSFYLVLRSGQYRISLILPFGYYPKSFSIGTTDLLRAPLDLSRASASEIVGIITTSPPDEAKDFLTVRGHANLNGFNGFLSPLVAVLQSEGSDRIGYFVLGLNSFEIRGVPPGTYRGYVIHGDFVPLPVERKDLGKTIVVKDKDLEDVELPLIVNPGLPR